MISRILERLEERRIEYEKASENPSFEFPQKMYYKGVMRGYEYSKDVVQEVAKEYGKDTNVRSNEWISCSERLPEKYVDVLVTVKHFEYPQMGHLEGGVWYADDTIKYLPDAVIAWMPLPAPYQKGE